MPAPGGYRRLRTFGGRLAFGAAKWTQRATSFSSSASIHSENASWADTWAVAAATVAEVSGLVGSKGWSFMAIAFVTQPAGGNLECGFNSPS